MPRDHPVRPGGVDTPRWRADPVPGAEVTVPTPSPSHSIGPALHISRAPHGIPAEPRDGSNHVTRPVVQLAQTGVTVTELIVFACLLVAVGAVLLFLAKQKKTQR